MIANCITIKEDIDRRSYMKKRFTCIAMFDKESLERFETVLIGLSAYKLCKVPYLKAPYTLVDREESDTLPYHFTLSYWDEDLKEEAIKVYKIIRMNKVEIVVDSVEIKKGNDGSYNMYFAFTPNQSLKDIQEQIYNETKNEKFNPETYLPHISIHSDKDYGKLINMKEIIMKKFESFTVYFDRLGLFEIYPANRVL